MDPLNVIAEMLVARQTALWNGIVPKCAVQIDIGATHTRYLHPRKGWRSVSNRRLGF